VLTATKDNSLADYIAVVVVLLMAAGTVFVSSASANIGQELNLQRFYDFPALRQILFFPMAVLVMYTVSCFNYRRFSASAGWLKSPTGFLLVLSIALLILVLLPQFGTEVHRARRWLRIPLGTTTVSFQPSELAKWSLVFFLAAFCDKFSDNIRLYWKRFVPACAFIAIVVGLIITEDFGTAALISLLIIAGAKWQHILTPLPFAVIGFLVVLIRSPGRMQRLAAFLNPEKWADSAAYQANQSLIALGSGGLFGQRNLQIRLSAGRYNRFYFRHYR